MRLDLAGYLGGGLIVGILTLPPRSLAIEIPLQTPLFVFVGGVGDLLFQLFLVVALLHRLGGDRGVGVIEKGAEAAAIQLKLNPVILDHDRCNPGGGAFGDGDAVALETIGVLLPVHGDVFVVAQIDALLGTRHVDLQHHFFAGEIALKRVRIFLRAQ